VVSLPAGEAERLSEVGVFLASFGSAATSLGERSTGLLGDLVRPLGGVRDLDGVLDRLGGLLRERDLLGADLFGERLLDLFLLRGGDRERLSVPLYLHILLGAFLAHYRQLIRQKSIFPGRTLILLEG
jgi:hypothetical protein